MGSEGKAEALSQRPIMCAEAYPVRDALSEKRPVAAGSGNAAAALAILDTSSYTES